MSEQIPEIYFDDAEWRGGKITEFVGQTVLEQGDFTD